MIDQFHIRALAAAGDKDAINIVKGLDILGWEHIDEWADGWETDFVPLPDNDTLLQLQQLGWIVQPEYPDRDCYWSYPTPDHLLVTAAHLR